MNEITVYSTPHCMQCKMTYVALDAKDIPYTVVDLRENPAALEYVTGELGYTQAPIVVVSDDDHWSGFRPDMIERIAKRAILPSDAYPASSFAHHHAANLAPNPGWVVGSSRRLDRFV